MSARVLGALAALLVAGCGSSAIYVDVANASGPWDGSESNPFQTIQDGLDAAGRDDVKVAAGTYLEQLTMNRGTRLRPWGPGHTVVIDGGLSTGVVIRAAGDNTLRDLTIKGGDRAVALDLGDALNGLSGQNAEAALRVWDCHIFSTSYGVYVDSPNNLSFGSNERRTLRLQILGTWVESPTNTGLFSRLIGPTSGTVQISLEVRHNVFENTGLLFDAKGQGPDPTRASYSGFIDDNLIFGGINGISLDTENTSTMSQFILNNTIANHAQHGIVATADPGPDGQSTIHVRIERNIIAGNGKYGYLEFTRFTSPTKLSHNLFHNNTEAHYGDDETGADLNTQSQLNTPIVNSQIVFFSGGNNLVADPLFDAANFQFGGLVTAPAGAFYLQQSSPAVNAGGVSVAVAKLDDRTTRTDKTLDTGNVDLGFHYKP